MENEKMRKDPLINFLDSVIYQYNKVDGPGLWQLQDEAMNDTLKGLCDILDEEADRAFRAVPAREIVGETAWEKAFMGVLNGRMKRISTFCTKAADMINQAGYGIQLPPDQKYIFSVDSLPVRLKERSTHNLFDIAMQHDTDPIRTKLNDDDNHRLMLSAGLMEQTGAIDEYKSTGEAQVLIGKAIKYRNDSEQMSLYLAAAQMEDLRNGIGTPNPLKTQNEYLSEKLTRAVRDTIEKTDKQHDYNDSVFCRKVADLAVYAHKTFSNYFADNDEFARRARLRPSMFTPPLKLVLEVAATRDSWYVSKNSWVQEYPEAAKQVQARLDLPKNEKDNDRKFLKYGEALMSTAIKDLKTFKGVVEAKGGPVEQTERLSRKLDAFEDVLKRIEYSQKKMTPNTKKPNVPLR